MILRIKMRIKKKLTVMKVMKVKKVKKVEKVKIVKIVKKVCEDKHCHVPLYVPGAQEGPDAAPH